jgi:hypothetical protein
MAPTQYRDTYIGNYQVLLPQNYPAVKPLYWNLALNRASRAHAIDMANNCGMQHNSCNGTAWNTRIKSYYTKSSTIAENIAAGNTTALATVKQWILETEPVPADLSPGDGHRKNIMTSSYRELGCGYSRGPQKYTYFWVHDFGGGKPDFTNPLVAGCHFFIETGKTTFFVNYYDSLAAPTNMVCTIDNKAYPMTIALGTAAKGTYTLVQTKGTSCRQYYFSCTKGSTSYRYPEYGFLVTSGEGSCAKDYVPPESVSVDIHPSFHKTSESAIQISNSENKILIYGSYLPYGQKSISIFNMRGQYIINNTSIAGESDGVITAVLKNKLPRGMCIIKLTVKNHQIFSCKAVIH